MSKLFRNGLLVLILICGALALGMHVAADSVATRLRSAFGPIASLSYESSGFSWDGRLVLRAPRLQVQEGLWRGTVQARVVYLEQSNPLWLIQQGLFSEQSVPSELRIEAVGLKLPDADPANKLAPWFDTATLTPFEIQGCGSDSLNAKDRARMGAPLAERRDHLTYLYNATTRRLELKLDLESPGIARWHLSSRLLDFSPAAWADLTAQRNLRLEHAEVLYDDPGYLNRRNAFCAQWLGVPVDAFIERHVAAVDTLLATHGIVPSSDVRSLYRNLVSKGGKLQLISLPDNDWMPSQVDAYPRSELLRLLNITARSDDAQPIMLRLVFHEPEQPLLFTVTAPVDGFAEETLAEIVDLGTSVAAPSAPEFSAPIIAENPAIVQEKLAAPMSPPAYEAPPHVAQVAPAPELHPRVPDLPSASAPPPPKNSTLALVWKPGVVERLATEPSAQREDSIISKQELSGVVGQRVRVQTTGGRRLDGRVVNVDRSRVVLLVQAVSGSAELDVPLSNISEIRLVRARESTN